MDRREPRAGFRICGDRRALPAIHTAVHLPVRPDTQGEPFEALPG